MSLLISIITVFIASSESSLTQKIHDPSNMIQAGLVLKCIKAGMTITIFTMNGVPNDYFVSFFFLITSICGIIYLSKAGYDIPIKPKQDEEQ